LLIARAPALNLPGGWGDARDRQAGEEITQILILRSHAKHGVSKDGRKRAPTAILRDGRHQRVYARL
jgi:hypothetical protein